MKILFIITILFLKKQISASENLCGDKKCVTKCCPDRHIAQRKTCVPYEAILNFDHLAVYDKNGKSKGKFADHFKLKHENFFEKGAKNEIEVVNSKIYTKKFNYTERLLENGTILYSKPNTTSILIDLEKYCIDYIIFQGTSKEVNIWFYKTDTTNTREENFQTWSLLISSIFLLVVLVVYLVLPELQNLAGKLLMGYVASLLLAYLFLFSLKVGYTSFLPNTCIAITSLFYYFILASCCWTNIMSYDIWWTFRGCVKARPINRRGEWFKFVMYCIYALGLPMSLTILLVVMNQMKPPGFIYPRILEQGCFIKEEVILLYLYVPMLIMIITNWVFFLLTAFYIWQLSRGMAAMLGSAESSSTDTASARRAQKQRLIAYLKLSVLMGLSWLLEVLSSFKPELSIWHVSDAYNLFVGLVIFLVFVCKRKVLKMLKKRFGAPEPPSNLHSTSTKTSSCKSRNATHESIGLEHK